MRRKPKENNFKAVLETIRDLMNTECVVPDWLQDVLLGYGDPGSAHYSRWALVFGLIQRASARHIMDICCCFSMHIIAQSCLIIVFRYQPISLQWVSSSPCFNLCINWNMYISCVAILIHSSFPFVFPNIRISCSPCSLMEHLYAMEGFVHTQCVYRP